MLVTTSVNTEGSIGHNLAHESALLSEIEKVKNEISVKLNSEYRDVWLKSLQTNDRHVYYNFLVMAQECAVEKLKKQYAHS